MNINNLLKTVGHALNKNSPSILTGLATAGVVATTVLAVRATPVAHKQVWEAEEERGEKIKPLEVVQITWRLYVPTAVMGAATIACVIGINTIHSRRAAALMSAFALTERAFEEYQSKVIEEVGDKKNNAIVDKVATERVEKEFAENAELLSTLSDVDEDLVLSNHNVLCYEMYSSRWFSSNIEAIRRAMNNVNQQCINDRYASLNDFYREVGISTSENGDLVGWNTDRMLEIDFTSILNPQGKPALALTFRDNPSPRYDKLW